MAEKQSQASEISAAIKQICEEKNIPYEAVIETIESALAVAYRKEYGQKGQDIRVEFNSTDASTKIFDVKTVVEDALFEEYEKEREEREKAEAEGKELPEKEEPKREDKKSKDRDGKGKKEGEEGEEDEKIKRFNPKTDIPLAEAQKEYPDIEVDDEIKTELDQPEGYGRMAAQTAKQVIIQKLREAERETLYNAYKDKAGEIINAIVQRVEGRMVFVDLGQAVAVLPPGEQIHGENYAPGQRIKVLLLSVERTSKGPEIVASRANPDLVKELFRAEVPEINDGTIEIKAIAREAGSRTKLAVMANDDSIDPIGSCVGQKGTRVQTIISELSGEKIDIIEWADDPVKFIINALSPAKILNVELKEGKNENEEQEAAARVNEDQFSLAIGKNGQNVRLASKLSGWKIDVVKEDGEGDEEHEDTKEKKESEEEEKDKKKDDKKKEDKKEDKEEEKK
ncbi:transcription termination factor NusA [Patescibacteria group bacterium]|nr:transcription termination factor NusA [Patescibacteria group bacterium]MBU1673140.1 transcription termination factor NusA [Patescibacteria group bacterium]MBU1963404.1 transcription termination factor NusA [Patescibacteria group bacterium]